MRLFLTLAITLLFAFSAPVRAQLAPPNDAGLTFAHVHLNVADIEVHKRLWVEHFGGVVAEKGSLSTVKLPNMLIVFTERAPSGPSQGTAMDHFGFKVRDIEPVLARWRAAGLEVQSEFTGAEGHPNAYLLAPDGVRFELQEDPTMTLETIGYHIHYWSRDFESLMAWYADVFGATVRQRGTIRTTADVPGMNLSFANCPNECAPTVGRAIDHVGFEIDDLEAFAARLQARGIEFQVAPRYIESIGLTIAFLTDPAGVRIELTEGFDEY
jgi:catechol 2,3-dioxygenase-like lactoylglutathione lyase family enzyme